jgi:hypothetical protein
MVREATIPALGIEVLAILLCWWAMTEWGCPGYSLEGVLKPLPLPGGTIVSVFQKLGSLNSEPTLPSTSYLPSTPSVVPASSYIPSSETPPGEYPAVCGIRFPSAHIRTCPGLTGLLLTPGWSLVYQPGKLTGTAQHQSTRPIVFWSQATEGSPGQEISQKSWFEWTSSCQDCHFGHPVLWGWGC